EVPRSSVSTGANTVVFRYRGGADALSIRAVALVSGGRVVAEDRHPGMTGSVDKANVYRLVVQGATGRGALELRVEAYVEPWSGGGNGDSRGEVWWVGNPGPVEVAPPDVDPPRHGATTPVEQDRDRAIYDWKARHAWVKRVGPAMRPDVVVIGDSIFHYWGGAPVAPIVRNEAAWRRAFGERSLNLGFGWDRTENVLQRIVDGELEGLDPKVVVVAIGTNNLSVSTADETIDGVDAVCRAVHARLPRARVLVLAILPRADASRLPARLDRVNFGLQTRLQPGPWMDVVDVGNTFLDSRGALRSAWFSDGLHPNAEGYDQLADCIAPLIARLRAGGSLDPNK
ncbi:MAG: GDSL-type esterase/lipase family protein, partial [Armatimonadota bacterium]